MTAKDIRIAAGRSRAWVAVQAGVSEPTCKLYEVAGRDVVGPRARASLDRVYGDLEAQLGSSPAGSAA